MSNKEIAELIEFVAGRSFALGTRIAYEIDEVDREAANRRYKELVADVTSGLEAALQQQGEPVVARQAGALIDAVEQVM